MAAIYDIDSGNDLTTGLQGGSLISASLPIRPRGSAGSRVIARGA